MHSISKHVFLLLYHWRWCISKSVPDWFVFFYEYLQGWGCCNSLSEPEKCPNWCSLKHLMENCVKSWVVNLVNFLTSISFVPALLNFLFHPSFLELSTRSCVHWLKILITLGWLQQSLNHICINRFSSILISYYTMVKWAENSWLISCVTSTAVFVVVYWMFWVRTRNYTMSVFSGRRIFHVARTSEWSNWNLYTKY